MQYELGSFTFSIPDLWRDDTTYAYRSADSRATILVESTVSSQTDMEILALATDHYVSVWGPLVIYKNAITLPRGAAVVPTVEGEQKALTGPERNRFALAAFATGRQAAVLTFLMSSATPFLPLLRRIVGGIELPGERGRDTAAGMARYRAAFLSLPIPLDWVPPLELSFLDPRFDGVELRVSIAEPLATRGTITLAKEAPGPTRTLSEETDVIAFADAEGWTGQWVLEGRDAARILVRKASVRATRGSALTLHGHAPERLAANLDAGWKSIMTSLASSGRP